MELVQEKYKQTDIGIIPNDWDITNFDNVADRNKKWSITGGPFGSNLKTTDYTDDGIQIIQLQNIGDGKFINDSQVFTSTEKANQLLSSNIYPGDIILSKMGEPVARACFIPNIAERLLMASDGIRLVVNEKHFNKRFVHDYINSIYFRKRAIEISTGSTRQRIGLPELKSLLVIKPPIEEQTAIAIALSDTDNWINCLEHLIEKKRLIKQGAMQELLQPKEGWKLVNLSENFTLKARIGWQGLTTSEYLKSGDYGLVTGTDFKKGFIDWDNCVFVEKIRFDQDKNIQLKEKDVLVTKDGTIGKVAFIDELPKPTTLNSGVFVIRPKKDFNNQFLYYILMSFHFDKFLEKITAGSTIVHLYQKDFMHFNFPAPSLSEQILITTILSDMDLEITTLENKLEKAKQVKLGMMQELLTGRIRLV